MTEFVELSRYTETDTSDHANAVDIIRSVLRERGKGIDNAIPSAELAAETEVSASTVRDLIPEVRKQYQIPIGSCNQGYFVIQSEEVFEQQVDRQIDQAKKSRMTAQDIAITFGRPEYADGK